MEENISYVRILFRWLNHTKLAFDLEILGPGGPTYAAVEHSQLFLREFREPTI